MSFNYPKSFRTNGYGGHRTANAATAVKEILSKETGDEVSLEPLIGNGSLSPSLPSEENQSGAVEELGATSPSSSSPAAYQDFKEIRSRCLAEGWLFEDPEFPAESRELGSLLEKQQQDEDPQWLRPSEICENPQLYVEGYSRFDAIQGRLGNCWLVAAMANLTLHRKLFFQVVPDDQSFDEDYAGVFHFRFWQFGRWVDVVIDDLLPTINRQLVFLQSSERNEFWSALLEKAYAKLHGSYEALKNGWPSEAMVDFTGGVSEMFKTNNLPPNFYTILLKAYERNSLIFCGTEVDPNVLDTETPEGLIRGHAYSVTRVKYVDVETPGRAGKIPLLRLRNPWGDKAEWNGPWSDKSPEWHSISESEKEELGLIIDDDGEFWIAFEDFCIYFDRVQICHWNPDSMDLDECPEVCTKKWEISVCEGKWVRVKPLDVEHVSDSKTSSPQRVKLQFSPTSIFRIIKDMKRGVTAGGSIDYLDSFWKNPQYTVTLKDPDEGDVNCTILVALMQKNRRHQGLEYLNIGFEVYRLPDYGHVPKRLDANFFKHNASVSSLKTFTDLREVSARLNFEPGQYVIVPSTYKPDEEGEFLLRVFSEKSIDITKIDEEVGMGDVDDRVKDIAPNPEPADQLRDAFNRLAGSDGEVDWQALKVILDSALSEELKGQKFSKDMCRSMITMLDKDNSGGLGFDEFQLLWTDLDNWSKVFNLYDVEGRSAIPPQLLGDALQSAGYTVNAHVLNVLAHRYGSYEGYVQFDDFIMCAVRVKTMFDTFKSWSSGGHFATFSLDEWLNCTVSIM